MNSIKIFAISISIIFIVVETNALYLNAKDIRLNKKNTSLMDTNILPLDTKDIYLNEKSISLIDTNNTTENNSNLPHSIQVYNNIKKYCKIYNVPERIAFKIANAESGFKGPMDLNYKSNLTSSANAVGPMQLIYSTALYMSDDKTISYNMVKNDIELNVKLSIKYLRYLFDRYKSWKIACGAYNTGRPIVNRYAIKVTT